jgi:hypothetical protein
MAKFSLTIYRVARPYSYIAEIRCFLFARNFSVSVVSAKSGIRKVNVTDEKR